MIKFSNFSFDVTLASMDSDEFPPYNSPPNFFIIVCKPKIFDRSGIFEFYASWLLFMRMSWRFFYNVTMLGWERHIQSHGRLLRLGSSDAELSTVLYAYL